MHRISEIELQHSGEDLASSTETKSPKHQQRCDVKEVVEEEKTNDEFVTDESAEVAVSVVVHSSHLSVIIFNFIMLFC